MSLGVMTLLGGGSLVAMATTATGSARPQDWRQLDWAATGSHYQMCIQRDGPGALGCMLSAGARPVAAAEPAGAATPREAPYYAVVTVPDQTARPAARPPARQAATPKAPAATPASRIVPTAPAALVLLPAQHTRDQAEAACQAATRTAQAQGPAAVQEVQRECAALLGGDPGDD